MTDYIGVAPDGPGRCEHAGCTEPGTDNGHCASHAMKRKVLAAMREQATEAYGLRDEPTYSRYECDRTALMFRDAADWLDDNWDEVTV